MLQGTRSEAEPPLERYIRYLAISYQRLLHGKWNNTSILAVVRALSNCHILDISYLLP